MTSLHVPVSHLYVFFESFCLIRGEVGWHSAGVEVLNFECKLALFLLNICSPFCKLWALCPRGEQCWRKRSPWELPAHGRDLCYLWCAAMWAPAMALPVWLRSSLGSETPPCLTADHSPHPHCHCPVTEPCQRAGRAGVCSPHVSGPGLWQSGCCQASGLLLMCCLIKHQPWVPLLPWMRPQVWITSVSHSWVISPDVTALSPVRSCDVKCGQHVLSAQAGCAQNSHGNRVATGAVLTLLSTPCLGSKPCACMSTQWIPSSSQPSC